MWAGLFRNYPDGDSDGAVSPRPCRIGKKVWVLVLGHVEDDRKVALVCLGREWTLSFQIRLEGVVAG
jgi:hypothetical protein